MRYIYKTITNKKSSSMVFFYLYLGVMGFISLYALINCIKDKEVETFFASLVSLALFAGVFALKTFNLYPILIIYFMVFGLIFFFVSDFGLLTLDPNPWGSMLKSFPTFTSAIGLISLLAAVEVWMEYNRHWITFQVIFVGILTIAFLTGFFRVVKYSRAGLILCVTLICAGISLYIHRSQYSLLNHYVHYWVISVAIQSIILLLWRFALKLDLAKNPIKEGYDWIK